MPTLSFAQVSDDNRCNFQFNFSFGVDKCFLFFFLAVSVPTRAETLRFLQHQRLMEENAKAIEIEQRYLAQLLLTRRHYQQMQMQMPYLANYMDALQVTDGLIRFPF